MSIGVTDGSMPTGYLKVWGETLISMVLHKIERDRYYKIQNLTLKLGKTEGKSQIWRQLLIEGWTVITEATQEDIGNLFIPAEMKEEVTYLRAEGIFMGTMSDFFFLNCEGDKHLFYNILYAIVFRMWKRC